MRPRPRRGNIPAATTAPQTVEDLQTLCKPSVSLSARGRWHIVAKKVGPVQPELTASYNTTSFREAASDFLRDHKGYRVISIVGRDVSDKATPAAKNAPESPTIARSRPRRVPVG